MKKNLISLLLLVVVAFGIYFFLRNNNDVEQVPVVEQKKPIELCFYKEGNKTPQGYYDVAWIRMNLLEDKVTGEFRNYPAEKDSKVGTFEGSVGKVDPYMMARTADVWWNAMQEGMQTKEQLKIVFGEGTANAMFGEMVDRGDGVYIYKDPNKFSYSMDMNDVACSDLDDRIMVEKYVRENIKTLAPEKPVLGGSWYALAIRIDPKTKTGTVNYEDGHVQGGATFSYTRIGDKVEISNIIKK